jgi:hypothetical protein
VLGTWNLVLYSDRKLSFEFPLRSEYDKDHNYGFISRAKLRDLRGFLWRARQDSNLRPSDSSSDSWGAIRWDAVRNSP